MEKTLSFPIGLISISIMSSSSKEQKNIASRLGGGGENRERLVIGYELSGIR